MSFQEMELAIPNFETPFILYTDASHSGIGGALCQCDEEGRERVISFASRTLNQHEKLYTTTELECLAIIFMIKKYDVFLLGRPFIIRADH